MVGTPINPADVQRVTSGGMKMVELPCPECHQRIDVEPPDLLECEDCDVSFWVKKGRDFHPWPPSLSDVGIMVALSVAVAGLLTIYHGYTPSEGGALAVGAFLLVMFSMWFGPM